MDRPYLIIPRLLQARMLAHVLDCLPQEACGLLGGLGLRVSRVTPIANAERSPVNFRMDPRAQVEGLFDLERAGLDLVGIYHSHPSGPAGLSATDLAEAAYPEALQLVWSPGTAGWNCRAFRLHPAGQPPQEIPIRAE